MPTIITPGTFGLSLFISALITVPFTAWAWKPGWNSEEVKKRRDTQRETIGQVGCVNYVGMTSTTVTIRSSVGSLHAAQVIGVLGEVC